MKILCIIDSFGRGGGAQTQLAGLARLLCEQGNKVTALSYHYRLPEYSFQEELEKAGVEYICLDKAKNKFFKLIAVYRIIKKYRPEVVVAYLDGPSIMGCLIRCVNANFRLVVSERSVTQRVGIKERFKFLLYRKADVIVTNSYTQQKFIITTFPMLSRKLYTIVNSVDLHYFAPAFRRMDEICIVHIVVVARIIEGKNVLRFLDALKILFDRRVKFTVDWYGLVYPEYYAKCLEKTKSLGLESVISYHDSVREVGEVYRKADVFCFPSLFEGCPNSLCEAMACGLPILCSNVCDNPLLVEEGKNGFLFDPYSAEEMADVIIRFIELSEREKSRMGKESRKMAEKKFSEEIFVKQYIQLFNR